MQLARTEFRISCHVGGERWPVGFGAMAVLALKVGWVCFLVCFLREQVLP